MYGWWGFPVVTQSVDPNTETTAIAENVVIAKLAKPTAPKAKNWQKVIAFSGSSIEKTQKFTINSNEWRIKWSTLPSKYGDTNFVVSVYDENGDIVNVVVTSVGKGADESYIIGTGTYSLEIDTVQKYNIIIEENE